jgi:hypothetical protein
VTTAEDIRIHEFIEDVCSYIKCKEVHREVGEELRGHLEDQEPVRWNAVRRPRHASHG